jgi:predicted transcriptional regulator
MSISNFCRFFRGPNWVTDRELKANLDNLKNQYPDLNHEIPLLRYFCEDFLLNSDSLALRHLSAYLESACVSAAWELHQKDHTQEYTLLDFVQIARLRLSEPTIVKNEQGVERELPYFVSLCLKYDPAQGKITTYVYLKLRSAIVSMVYKNQQTQRLSDWALLKKTRKPSLTTALKQAGTPDAQIQSCLNCLQAFHAVYGQFTVEKNRKLPEPTEAQWMAICQYLSEQNLAVNLPEVKNLLNTCVQVLREHDKIQIIALDGVDKTAQKRQELELVEEWETQLVYSEEKQELLAQDEELMDCLGRAIAVIPKKKPQKGKPSIAPCQLVILFYAFPGLTETKIAALFGVNQATISRYLHGYKTSILKNLADWLHNERGLELTTEKIAALSEQLEFWLKSYCRSRVVYCFLRQGLKYHPELKKNLSLLSNHFGNLPEKTWAKANSLERYFKPSELSEQLSYLNQAARPQCTEMPDQAKLEAAKAKLHQQLTIWLQQTLGLKDCDLSAIARPSSLLIDCFLYQADYAILQQERR